MKYTPFIVSFTFVSVEIGCGIAHDQKANHVRGAITKENAFTFSRALHSNIQEVEFGGKLNSACRTKEGVRGEPGADYERLDNVSLMECMIRCQDSFNCEGYEYKSIEDDVDDEGVCHLWNSYAPGSHAKEGHLCFWKQTACCEPLLAACNKEFKPVKCGAKACEYDNYCLAANAGWDETECERRCLKPTSPNLCEDKQFNPVRCGDCAFENLCLAKEAGYSEDSCSLTCDYVKNPGCTVACTMEYIPVTCGENQCIFANVCDGTKGFGFAESQCVESALEVDEKVGEP